MTSPRHSLQYLFFVFYCLSCGVQIGATMWAGKVNYINNVRAFSVPFLCSKSFRPFFSLMPYRYMSSLQHIVYGNCLVTRACTHENTQQTRTRRVKCYGFLLPCYVGTGQRRENCKSTFAESPGERGTRIITKFQEQPSPTTIRHCGSNVNADIFNHI